MKKLTRVSLILIALLFLIISCDLFTTPEEIKPGRRDYVWKVDTVKIHHEGRVNIARVWGTSANNIYISNWGNSPHLFHYDGVKCEPFNFNLKGNISGIWGTEPDDIWFSTTAGYFGHYDGNQMANIYESTVEGYKWVCINNMCGINKNEIYAVGFVENPGNDFNRLILKYDGTKWDMLEINSGKENLEFLRIDGNSGNIFISGFRRLDQVNCERKYVLKGIELHQIAASNIFSGFGSIGNRVYHTLEQKIYYYQSGQMTLFMDFSGTDYFTRMWGRTEKDFFTLNHGNSIEPSNALGHYNGEDLINIYQTPGKRIAEAIVFDEEIIVVSDGSVQNEFYVSRGVLVEM